MNKLLLLVLLTTAPVVAWSQVSRTDLQELDELINDPSSEEMVTSRAYKKLIYRDQQAIGGSVIRESKVVGSSATLTEKSVTVNIGFPVISLGRHEFALLGTLRGQSEESFVKVFAKDAYSNTLGVGGSVLYFLPWLRNVYSQQARLDLHHRIRKLRNTTEGRPFPDFGLLAPLKKDSLRWTDPLEPVDGPTWKTRYNVQLKEFAAAWRRQQLAEDAYKAALPADETRLKAELRLAEATYQRYAAAVGSLLPAEWGSKSDNDRATWVNAHFNTANEPQPGVLDELRITYNDKLRLKRLTVYDSLQLQAVWARRYRPWLSANLLSNVTKQPLFDGASPTTGYRRTYDDNYFESQFAMNFLVIHAWGKQYFSAGGGWTNKLTFDKSKLTTYQYAVWQPNGTDSVQIVKQAEAYPDKPNAAWVKNVQAQYSIYSQRAKVGLDVTGRLQWGRGYTRRHVLTAGVFVPIQTSGSTLLLMPQVSWASIDVPNQLTFGFNLSASIPGFVTKEK